MADVICPLCGSSPTEEIARVKREGQIHPLVRCVRCTLIFVCPRPTAEALRTYYVARGEARTYTAMAKHIQDEHELYQARFQRRLREITRYARPPGRLLDVGCQQGLFVTAAQAQGYGVQGVELLPEAAREAQRRSQAEIFTGELSDARYPPAHFDVVTCWHLIEHLLHPLEFLREVHRILKPGGLLALETPNIASRNFQRQGSRWEYIRPPEHINYFDCTSLTHGLRLTHFNVCYHTYDQGTSVGPTLDRLKLGRLRQWGRRHYRWIAPLRSLYLASVGRLVPQEDILVLLARAQQDVPA